MALHVLSVKICFQSARFWVILISCNYVVFLGWYRTSGEGRAARRQCPQPAQYSGHHHCELLFISPPSALTFIFCLCLLPLMLLLFGGYSFSTSSSAQFAYPLHPYHYVSSI